MSKYITVLLFIVFLFCMNMVSAQDLFVDVNSIGGVCSNSYTKAQNNITHPYCTVHQGVSAAVAGDTVYIRAGTYFELDNGLSGDCPDKGNADCGTLKPIRDGTVGNPITFKGYPGEAKPIISGNPTTYALSINMHSNLVFDSLEVANAYRGITITADSGGKSQNIIIRNCYIHDNDGPMNPTGNNNAGIILYDTWADDAGNILLENNIIHNNKDPSCFEGTGAGIQSYGVRNLTIRNNIIHDEYGGIYLKGNLGYGTASDQNQYGVSIYNNTIYNVKQGIYSYEGNNISVYNNVVFNFTNSGIGGTYHDGRIFDHHKNFSYYQNTVIGSGTGGCFIFKNIEDAKVYNNIFTNCDYGACTVPSVFERNFGNSGVGSNVDPDYGPDLAINFKENNNLNYNVQGPSNYCWYGNLYTLATWKTYWQGQGTTNGQNNLASAPSFVNSLINNYRLISTSPGIDNGTLIPGFHCARADDNSTNPYPLTDNSCRHWSGKAPDIGAFESTNVTVQQPNECKNWQTNHPEWIFCDDFESGNLSNWDQTGTMNTITTDLQNVLNGNNSMQAQLNTANDGGENLAKWFMPGYDEIYVRFYIKFQSGFQNLRSDGNGMHVLGIAGNRIDDAWSSFGHSGTVPTGTDRFTTAVDPGHVANDGTLRPFEFYSYFPEMSCSGGCWGNLFSQTAPQVPLLGGQWQLVEARVKTNTPGLYDGLQELWINDTLKVSVQNMRWRDTTDLKLNDIDFFFYMPNTIGTQYIYVDNVVVSRQHIGAINAVIPSVISCGAQSGTICSANQTCSGSWLTANDTNRCCSTVCQTPTVPAVVVSVDSTYSDPNIDKSYLIDGTMSLTNSWASSDVNVPHWAALNFSNSTTIGNVTIWWAWNAPQGRYMTSQRVMIEYWNGVSYINIINITSTTFNNTNSTATFSPINTTSIRFYQPVGSSPPTYTGIMWISELQYGQGSACTTDAQLNIAIQQWYSDSIRISQLMFIIKAWKTCSG
jgi:hypothetical protein